MDIGEDVNVGLWDSAQHNFAGFLRSFSSVGELRNLLAPHADLVTPPNHWIIHGLLHGGKDNAVEREESVGLPDDDFTKP